MQIPCLQELEPVEDHHEVRRLEIMLVDFVLEAHDDLINGLRGPARDFAPCFRSPSPAGLRPRGSAAAHSRSRGRALVEPVPGPGVGRVEVVVVRRHAHVRDIRQSDVSWTQSGPPAMPAPVVDLVVVVLPREILAGRVCLAEEEVVLHPERLRVQPWLMGKPHAVPAGPGDLHRYILLAVGAYAMRRRRTERVVGAQRADEIGMIVFGGFARRHERELGKLDRLVAERVGHGDGCGDGRMAGRRKVDLVGIDMHQPVGIEFAEQRFLPAQDALPAVRAVVRDVLDADQPCAEVGLRDLDGPVDLAVVQR